jgi:hypothetical protein
MKDTGMARYFQAKGDNARLQIVTERLKYLKDEIAQL